MKIFATSLCLGILLAAGASGRNADAQDKKPPQPAPLRILLFAGGPTREFQLLRAMLLREPDKAQLSICLQTADEGADLGVPVERMLRELPLLSAPKQKGREYDLVIAFDPDWSRVPANHIRSLEEWVNQRGGGFILVAGPVNTNQLARSGGPNLAAVAKLLPVKLKDNRLHVLGIGPDDFEDGLPNALRLADDKSPAVGLDRKEASPAASWETFFWNGPRPADAKKAPPRGFYSYYPVEKPSPAAHVLAYLVDRKAREHPFLAVQHYGAGRVTFVASGELWRLRSYRTAFHETLWWNLAEHTSGQPTSFTAQSSLVVRRHSSSGGETIEIEARLVDEKGTVIDPRTNPSVRVVRKLGGATTETTVRLRPRAATSAGLYDASVLLSEPGDYTLTVAVPNLNAPLSTAIKIKSLFEFHVDDGNLANRQAALFHRSIAWSQAVLTLAKRLAAAKDDPAFRAEAKHYQSAIDATVEERWAIRYESLGDALRNCPSRKVNDFRAAHDESQAIAQQISAMRARLLGKEQAKELRETLDLLRKWAEAEDAIELALTKDEPRSAEGTLRLLQFGGDVNAEMMQAQVKKLLAYRERLEQAEAGHAKILKELADRGIRPETMRFLNVRMTASLSALYKKDLKLTLVALGEIEKIVANGDDAAKAIKKAHAQLEKLQSAIDGLRVERVAPIFEELIQLEIDQAEQSRVLAQLRKQLEADLLKGLGPR